MQYPLPVQTIVNGAASTVIAAAAATVTTATERIIKGTGFLMARGDFDPYVEISFDGVIYFDFPAGTPVFVQCGQCVYFRQTGTTTGDIRIDLWSTHEILAAGQGWGEELPAETITKAAALVNVYARGVSTAGVTTAVTADTELPAAAALSDTSANPTTPLIGACLMMWDGVQWVRAGDGGGLIGVAVDELPAAAALSDTISNPTASLIGACKLLWDSSATQWVREQSVQLADSQTWPTEMPGAHVTLHAVGASAHTDRVKHNEGAAHVLGRLGVSVGSGKMQSHSAASGTGTGTEFNLGQAHADWGWQILHDGTATPDVNLEVTVDNTTWVSIDTQTNIATGTRFTVLDEVALRVRTNIISMGDATSITTEIVALP